MRLAVLALLWFGLAVPSAQAAEGRRYLDPVFQDLTVTKDVRFGEATTDAGARQLLRLDVRAPALDTERRRPALLWAFGGGFKTGSKDGVAAQYAEDFARRGWVGIAMDYRIRPDGPPNATMLLTAPFGESAVQRDARHDLQAAVRYVRFHADALGVDPDKIVLAGNSAGAISALGAAVDPDDPGDSGDVAPARAPSTVAALVSVSGATDARRMQPGLPPVRMFHGTNDTTVPLALAEQTCGGWITVGAGTCELTAWPGVGHGAADAKRTEVVPAASRFLCDQVLAGCPTVEVPGPDAPPVAKARSPRTGSRTISGRASDPDGRVARVEVAVLRRDAGRCRTLRASGRFGARQPCAAATRSFLPAEGTIAWSFRVAAPLPRARYVVYARATDERGLTGRVRRVG